MTKKIKLFGLKSISSIKKGDDIAQIIYKSCKNENLTLREGDIILIAQTIITKSIGRIKDLSEINPSQKAYEIYNKIKPLANAKNIPLKSPELIQVILDESKKILRAEHVIITETHQGFICANAGIDKSNIEGETKIGLLPKDPDLEAEKIRRKIQKLTGKKIAVIITDSFGRPFRIGSVGVALGVAGISPLKDQRGKKDLYGKTLQSTIIGQIDNLASSAQLLMGEANEGLPVVIVRGYKYKYDEDANISSIIRGSENDLFRGKIENSFKQLLKNRRSYKLKYTKRKVDRRIIEKCIEIARWAPSAHNAQLWRYIILERGPLRKKLINKMNKKYKSDLKKDGKSKSQIKKRIQKTRTQFIDSPFLILLCLDKEDLEKYPDKERIKNEYLLGVQGISASATYLLISFEIMGLSACWYCAPLFAKKVVREVLNLAKNIVPMAFFTVGYGEVSKIKAPIRKKLKDIILEI
jgi:coenzyme F420-0:L-glutamate ligase/coenzyme F420-1:gamma-L-glutamate ligase